MRFEVDVSYRARVTCYKGERNESKCGSVDTQTQDHASLPVVAALPGGQQGGAALDHNSVPWSIATSVNDCVPFTMDRVNCTGSSDVCFPTSIPEPKVHAMHLLEALRASGCALPAALVGSSSGARVCLLAALLAPAEVACVVALDPSTSPDVVASAYYDIHASNAQSEGLPDGVASSGVYSELMKHNKRAAAQLEVTELGEFVHFMQASSSFLRSHAPTVDGVQINAGLTAQEAQQVQAPVLVCHTSSQNDPLHPLAVSNALSKLLPSCTGCVAATGSNGVGVDSVVKQATHFIEEHLQH